MSKIEFTGDWQDLTPSDQAIVLSGGFLTPGSSLTLPSGRLITSATWERLGGAIRPSVSPAEKAWSAWRRDAHDPRTWDELPGNVKGAWETAVRMAQRSA